MAGGDHGAVARQIGEEAFQQADPFEIEMVGRLVQQQQVGLDHHRPRQQHRALPAAGEAAHSAIAQALLHHEIVEQHVDAPALGLRRFGIERVQHRIIKAHRQQALGRVLRCEGGDEAARPGKRPATRFLAAGQDTQERGFAAPIGGDEAEPVALGDGEVETSEKRRAASERKVFEGDHEHRNLMKSGMRAGARRQRLTMRRQCVPGQPREVKRGAQTGPRVRQWKRRRGACFPFGFDSMAAIIAGAAPVNRASQV